MHQSTRKHYRSTKGSVSIQPMGQKYDHGFAMHSSEIAQSRKKHFKMQYQDEAVRKECEQIGVKGASMFGKVKLRNRTEIQRAKHKAALARKAA